MLETLVLLRFNGVMRLLRRYPLVLATVATAAIALALWLANNPATATWIITIFVLGIIAWVSVGMIRDIARGHWGLDILAVVAMGATLATGEYAAALIVALMLTGGEALEDYAEHRARDELTSLLDRSPEVAQVLASPGAEPRDTPVDQVRPGDLLLIRPSQVVPVDLLLSSPEADFDTSSLTGEPLPVSFVAGDEVPSGAVNGPRAVTGRAHRPAAESQYQRVLALVAEAESSKAPLVRLADRFAIPFTLFSLALAGLAWWISGDSTRFAQVLVLATPCPLLIAAPVAFLGGLSQTAKNGVIVKGGSVLEQLARVASVAFDKTGTLTQGRPELIDVAPQPGFTRTELLSLGASAEQYSTHVFAAGIIARATREGVKLSSAVEATEHATHGVEAIVDGRRVRVGKREFIEDDLAIPTAVHALDLEPGEAGAFISVDGVYAGAFILSDPIRPESAGVVQWLQGEGITPVMLTGDAHTTAAAVADQVGIANVHSGLIPEDKVNLLKELQTPTLMVGDGVNDAPVLAFANVGIALGARGATAAGAAADAVILRDDLGKVIDTVRIARHTVSVAMTAMWIGVGLSVGLMLIAATGVIPAVVGALTQEFVDLAAILYALRARRSQAPWRPAPAPAPTKRSATIG